MDLSVINQVWPSDMAFLVLKKENDEMLRYFIIASQVGFKVVNTGVTPGEISKDIVVFSILLDSINLLVSKGYSFDISYSGDKLQFVDSNNKFVLNPLYVSSLDAGIVEELNSFLDFYNTLQKRNLLSEEIRETQNQMRSLEARLEDARPDRPVTQQELIEMAFVSDNPFESPSEKQRELEQQKEYAEVQKLQGELAGHIESLSKQLDEIPVKVMDIEPLRVAAMAAGKYKTTVEVFSDYAVVKLGTAYLFSKGVNGNAAYSGELLSKLVSLSGRTGGLFYDTQDGIVFHSHGAKKNKKDTRDELSETFVFVSRYLPTAKVDSSLITRGVTEEKYVLHIGDAIPVINATASKLPELSLDLGEGKFVLSNEQGVQIDYSLSVEEARSIQLNRLMKGKSTSGTVQMAVLSIPKPVRAMLSIFKESLTVYVKHEKVIFNCGDNWLVFGRG